MASGATSSGKRSGGVVAPQSAHLVHRAKRNKVQHDIPRTLQTENSEQIVNPHLPLPVAWQGCGDGNPASAADDSVVVLNKLLKGLLELVLPRPLLRVGGKAGLKAVERQLVSVLGRQARGGKQLGEVLVDVAPK